MKVLFDVESKTIQVSVNNGESTVTEAMNSSEALLVADMIKSMALTIQPAQAPVGALTREIKPESY